MAKVIDNYICVAKRTRKDAYNFEKWKNIFLIKAHSTGNRGQLKISAINFPKGYIGKRIKIRIEVEAKK